MCEPDLILQPTINIRPAAIGAEQKRPQSVAITPRQTRAMTGRELPGTSAASNTLASTSRKRTRTLMSTTHLNQCKTDSRQCYQNWTMENLQQCSRGQPDDVNLQHAPQQPCRGSSRRQTRSMTQRCETQARCQCRRMLYQECLQETPIFRGDTT